MGGDFMFFSLGIFRRLVLWSFLHDFSVGRRFKTLCSSSFACFSRFLAASRSPCFFILGGTFIPAGGSIREIIPSFSALWFSSGSIIMPLNTVSADVVKKFNNCAFNERFSPMLLKIGSVQRWMGRPCTLIQKGIWEGKSFARKRTGTAPSLGLGRNPRAFYPRSIFPTGQV